MTTSESRMISFRGKGRRNKQGANYYALYPVHPYTVVTMFIFNNYNKIHISLITV